MRKINMNVFAKEVTLEEAGKKQISIAQVKEVLKIAFKKLANEYDPSQIAELIERYY